MRTSSESIVVDASTLRTPFHIAQPLSEIFYVMKRTNRHINQVHVEGKEETATVDGNRKSFKQIVKELDETGIDTNQNLTIYFYFDDCVLKFKKYRGLSSDGERCYRVVNISKPGLNAT